MLKKLVSQYLKLLKPISQTPRLFILFIFLSSLFLGTIHKQQIHAEPTGINKIQHVIVIMQENRSFDHYFGTFPGADGIAMDSNGVPTVCVPDPASGNCQRPYVDHRDNNSGGPHGASASATDINGGSMDGFITEAESGQTGCTVNYNPNCGFGPMDVMGYHTQSDIPNYWSYASNFVLQDRMFAPTDGWSLAEHLHEVSGWSATCTEHNNPSSCTSNNDPPFSFNTAPIYAQTDLTYLLHKQNVSWGYYVVNGNEPDCRDDATNSCDAVTQNAATPSVWNPLPGFDTVQEDGEVGNVQSVDNFYTAAQNGTLPQVSWVAPSFEVSEHGPSPVSSGQSYVTSLVNAVMNGPDWNSTAIFVSWDEWGGFYDHVVPPSVDVNGYGLRVPGIVISPYAKQGYIDHQTLSFDAYLKFIEDDFLGGQRIDPLTDGRPDPRPLVRENVSILGDLTNDFDFSQSPRSPMLLPVHPTTTLAPTVPFVPRIDTVTTGNGSATVSWTMIFGNGGSPLTGSVITPYIDGVAQPQRVFNNGSLTQTVTGLTNGKNYTFKVAGVNALGTGYFSKPSVAKMVGTPTAPRNPKALPGNGTAKVSWTAPSSNNGAPITSYIVIPYIGSTAQKAQGFTSTALSETLTGLTNGTTYTFKVYAKNIYGLSPLSTATYPTIVGSPLPPTGVTVTAGTGRVTVHWTAPSSNNGSAINGYVITPLDGYNMLSPITFNSTSTTQTITGLNPGTTYTFWVSAKNSRGIGPHSILSPAATPN